MKVVGKEIETFTCEMRAVITLAILLVANGKIFPLETIEHQMERMALNDVINGNPVTKVDKSIVDTDKYKNDLIHDFWLMKRNDKEDATGQRSVQGGSFKM